MTRATGLGWKTAPAALVALGVLSACSASQEHRYEPPAATATPVVFDTARLHLPIETYMLTPYETVEYDHLSHLLLGDCMQRFGFDYPVAPLPGRNSTAVLGYTILYRRYGLTDDAEARTWGYHRPRQTPSTRSRGATATGKKLMDYPPAARLVLMGAASTAHKVVQTPSGERTVPPGGCAGEAYRRLESSSASPQGPGSEPGGLVARIKRKSFADSMHDSRVTTVFHAWASCMKSHGYEARSPLQVTANLASIRSPAPSAEEISRAVADTACKKDTNLADVWYAVESDYQKAAIAENRSALATIKNKVGAQAAVIRRLANSRHL